MATPRQTDPMKKKPACKPARRFASRVRMTAFVIGALISRMGSAQAVWEYPPLAHTPEGSNGWLATIPFAEDGDQYFVAVRATIGSTKPVWWLIDTGTGNCQIDSSFARTSFGDVHGRIKNSEYPTGIGSATTISVRLGSHIAVNCESIATTDMSGWLNVFGRPIVGILGYDLFANYVVEIDYVAHSLRLYDPSRYRYSGMGDTIPLTFDGKHPRIPVKISDGGRVATRTPFFVMASSDAISDSLVIKSSTTPRYEVTSWDANGTAKVLEGTLEEAQIGRFRLSHLPSTAAAPGLAGAAVWRRFTCIVDYPHRRMFLEPNERYGAVFDRGARSGLSFLARSASVYPTVASVIPGSPGALAGIRIGDIIYEFDGRSSKEFGVDRIEHLANRVGATYRLRVRRGRKAISITLRV